MNGACSTTRRFAWSGGWTISCAGCRRRRAWSSSVRSLWDKCWSVLNFTILGCLSEYTGCWAHPLQRDCNQLPSFTMACPPTSLIFLAQARLQHYQFVREMAVSKERVLKQQLGTTVQRLRVWQPICSSRDAMKIFQCSWVYKHWRKSRPEGVCSVELSVCIYRYLRRWPNCCLSLSDETACCWRWGKVWFFRTTCKLWTNRFRLCSKRWKVWKPEIPWSGQKSHRFCDQENDGHRQNSQRKHRLDTWSTWWEDGHLQSGFYEFTKSIAEIQICQQERRKSAVLCCLECQKLKGASAWRVKRLALQEFT